LLTVSPRGIGSPARAPALATWSLIALTVAVYLLQLVVDETRAQELILRYGMTPEIFGGGERPFGGFPPLLTPLTSMFLHGSWDHLLGNMIYLWVFGDDIEEVLGAFRFLVFYLLCGVCGALGYALMDSHATIALLGASGSVSGVIAAYLMLKPCEPLEISLPGLDLRMAVYWAVGGWLLLQLFQYLWHAEDESFSSLAQAGGVLAGAIAFWGLSPRGTKLFRCVGPRETSATDTIASA
jgi:membrane associated rhomboid family serine protease